MKTVKLTVFGPDPPCVRCTTVKKNAEAVAKKYKNVKVVKADIAARETVKKYGVLLSPALAVNGIVKFMGRIPSEKEIESEVKKA
jgi:glutaredoxin